MQDPFMSSMTFASHDFRAERIGCDCDECGIRTQVQVPSALLTTFQVHKRQKLQEGIKRSQSRTLLNRDPNGISLYQWVLPSGAEPLVEFGSSHRILWVERLPKNGSIFSIGKGIIGSSDEEKSRVRMNWKEGGLYLVPSNGGKAMGWIYHAGVDSSEPGNGHAELKIAKIPQDLSTDYGRGKETAVCFIDDSSSPAGSWAIKFKETCRDILEAECVRSDGDEHSGFMVQDTDIQALKTAFGDADRTSENFAPKLGS